MTSRIKCTRRNMASVLRRVLQRRDVGRRRRGRRRRRHGVAAVREGEDERIRRFREWCKDTGILLHRDVSVGGADSTHTHTQHTHKQVVYRQSWFSVGSGCGSNSRYPRGECYCQTPSVGSPDVSHWEGERRGPGGGQGVPGADEEETQQLGAPSPGSAG